MSTSSIPVRVLVAGAGAFGRKHLARLAGRPDASLAGLAGANPRGARADQPGMALSFVSTVVCG